MSMRSFIIGFLRKHPRILSVFWFVLRCFLKVASILIPVRKKTILFASYGGRNFDDSSKSLYDTICNDSFFDDYTLIWAFVNPDDYDIPRGIKIKIDTPAFFKALIYSKVWISNSGMDRNIDLNLKRTIKIETFHGIPLKKLGCDQNSGILGNHTVKGPLDSKTIRCANSEYDREIFERIFNASKDAFLMCGLPRNDELYKYTDEDKKRIKENLKLADDKKVILYMPTYREYLMNEKNEIYIKPPINLDYWEKELGDDYIVLFRAHYAVNASLGLKESSFIRDVSRYSSVNELYCVADLLITDYSSSFFDYSILEKPMFCFAYDKEEYEEKRGLYLKLEETLPCRINKTEKELIDDIKSINYEDAVRKTREFKRKFLPSEGKANIVMIEKLKEQLSTVAERG